MTDFSYQGFPHPVRENLRGVHGEVWERVAGPGSWWTGSQRVAVAEEVRAARAARSEPPWLRDDSVAADGLLPEAAARVVRRVAIDAPRLDRAWCEEQVAELTDAAYVELVSVAACVTAVDAFGEALGAELEPLPTPRAGDPDRERPDGMSDAGAWVPMTVPFQGPNVGRALSLAPADHGLFMRLVASMYAFADFAELVWSQRPLTRPQVELLAARVSAVNECFY